MKSSSPPLINSFKLVGLHGYKSLSIEFRGEATIVVAENGSGKTTLLNALAAFLTTRFGRLTAIDFEYLECWFNGMLEPVRLHRADLGQASQDTTTRVADLAARAGVGERELIELLRWFEPGSRSNDITQYNMSPLVRDLYLATPGPIEELRNLLIELKTGLDIGHSESAKAIAELVRSKTKSYEIIYLPTYRRVEVALMRQPKQRGFRHREEPQAGVSAHSGSESIAFGMSDVEKRLNDISEDIERRSNQGYRVLSAQLIEDMLRGQLTAAKAEALPLPDPPSLQRFLDRVSRHSRPSSTTAVTGVAQLYESSEIDSQEKTFLRYFLGRLGRVIDETRETEAAVERFVEICSGYLRSSDDGKELTYDALSLAVIVRDLWTGKALSLDSLSSGEKQIVSMMARMYLDNRPKIVLIDEPELSLSIDWQRRVLPDLMHSGNVAQMLAITHSPFVFENELDPATVPLILTRTVNVTVTE